MKGWARIALGSLAGAVVAAVIAPALRPYFGPPEGGVGVLTVHGYPKGWDYAVVALLFLGAFIGGTALAFLRRDEAALDRDTRPSRGPVIAGAVAVFLLMFFAHDHPYAPMDPFHEGEHITAGWLMKSGERPYGDFFIFHGLAYDAGIDAASLGDPPNPARQRRVRAVLNAAALALLVPIAAELTLTSVGMLGGVFVSLCGIAAFWLPVFPYHRLAPVLIAVFALFRYVRGGSAAALFVASASATLGLLWSFDTGTYAVAGVVGSVVVLRVLKLEAKPLPLPRLLAIGLVALALPLIVLVAVGADIRQFFIDSFVILPRSVDAVWSLPAKWEITAESLRYYLPIVFYGFLAAMAVLAFRRGDRALAARIAIVTIFSALLFRSAAGRVSWSHTRFALPLLGIAVTAFVLEPLVLRRRWLAAAALAVPLFFHFEIAENMKAGTKLIAEWPARQRPTGLVPYPFRVARGLYTYEENAIELASLSAFIDSLGPAGAPILDLSNERALYYFLQRKPPIRTMEISMLSVPRLRQEAMAQLERNPPVAVVLRGYDAIAEFDGLSNEQRVPELAAWIDANYPRQTQIGRFLVAHR